MEVEKFARGDAKKEQTHKFQMPCPYRNSSITVKPSRSSIPWDPNLAHTPNKVQIHSPNFCHKNRWTCAETTSKCINSLCRSRRIHVHLLQLSYGGSEIEEEEEHKSFKLHRGDKMQLKSTCLFGAFCHTELESGSYSCTPFAILTALPCYFNGTSGWWQGYNKKRLYKVGSPQPWFSPG